MRRKPSLAGDDEAQAIRFAFGIALIATLTVAAILGLAGSAQALALPGAKALDATAAAPFGDEGEDAEAGAGEDEDFESEDCEDEADCEEEAEDGNSEAPEECLLTGARASVVALASQDRVRFQLRYATSSPTAVAVEYGLHGSKGSLFLGAEKKRFGRHGTLRLSEDLSETEMAKVLAARNFTVKLRVPAAPRYCQSFFDRQLDVKRATPGGFTWQQAE
jgi:hypothetical protein